jgi:hypothetical protein
VVIREDKVLREVLRVVPATEPMDVAILVDNSQAADSYIRDYREALPAFITAMSEDESGARHQFAVITLAERPTINTDYTLDPKRAIEGARRIFSMSGSGAYMLDGIIETSKGLARRPTPRAVMLIITSEGPDLSDRQYNAVLEPLRASGASMHVIVIGRPTNANQDRSIVLDVGTKDTGGRYDTLLTPNGLTARLKQVAAELTHQFKVTYSRPQSLLQPDRVTVTSGKPSLTIRGIADRTKERS